MSTVKLREFYNNYRPPRYVYRTVKRILGSIPVRYSAGLDSVVLTNYSGKPRRHRSGKLLSRGRRVPQSDVAGLYHHAGRGGKLPWIELYVDKIAAGARKVAWVPIMRETIFAQVLLHEVGHHIHANFRPEYREKEDVADDWGKKLTRDYLRARYPHLRLYGKPLMWILRAWLESWS